MTYKLLIVDDEEANLRLLTRLFNRDFDCLSASSGAEAIKLLEQHDVAILISDQRMPEMTGIELLKRTASMRPNMVRILLTGYTDIEALVDALNCGLVYQYVTKPWSNDDLKFIVNRACQHYEGNKNSSALVLANERLQSRLKAMEHGVVTALSDMARTRDSHADGHAIRVGKYAKVIAEKMGLNEEAIAEMSAAALLHDLGGIGITRHALGTGCLVANQNAIFREHSGCEARLLAALPELETIADAIKFQRENVDGTGFPAGLETDQIPLFSRILRVADEYDLMVLPRASAGMSYDEAMKFLNQHSGKRFDPNVVDTMLQLGPDSLANSQTSTSLRDNQSFVSQDNFEPSFAEAVLS